MIRVPFHDGWTVGPKLGAFEALTRAAAAQPVTLPHDAIRDLRGRPTPTRACTPATARAASSSTRRPSMCRWSGATRRSSLEFEGVYRDAGVFVNGDFVAHEPNGYSAFVAVLDPYLRYGEPNRITVEASAHKDSRWYSGAGIYRPVHLSSPIPCTSRSTALRVTTPDIDADRAIVAIATTVANDTRHTRTTRVAWTVHGPGRRRGRVGTRRPSRSCPGTTATARTRLAVPTPQLWHPDTRALRGAHDAPTTRQAIRSTRMPRPSASGGCSSTRSTDCASTARSSSCAAPACTMTTGRSAPRRSPTPKTGACGCSRRPGSTRSAAPTTR